MRKVRHMQRESYAKKTKVREHFKLKPGISRDLEKVSAKLGRTKTSIVEEALVLYFCKP